MRGIMILINKKTMDDFKNTIFSLKKKKRRYDK